MRAVNLIPADQRAGASGFAGRSGGAAYVVVGLVAGLAVLAALYGVARHEIASREGEAAKLSAQAAEAEAQANRLAPYVKFAALREARVKAVQELVNTRFDWAHSMHELGRVLPGDVSLESVDGTVGPATATVSATQSSATPGASTASSVTSATPPGSTPSFSISGCTKTQSDVALAMDRLRLMDGVREVSLQSSQKASSSTGTAGSTSGGGSCPDSFSVQVSFEGLPTPEPQGSGEAGSGERTSTAGSTGGAAEAGGAAGRSDTSEVRPR